MVFIGSRVVLSRISNHFKDVWISFIREYNRAARKWRYTPEQAKEKVDSLREKVSILRNEISRIQEIISRENDYKKNLTSLRVMLEEIDKGLIGAGEGETRKRLHSAKGKIREAKALITISVNSKIGPARRKLLKGAAAATLVATFGPACATTRKLLAIPAEKMRVVFDGGFYKILDSENIVAQGPRLYFPFLEIVKELLFVHISVVHNGKAKDIVLTPNQLKKAVNPTLVVKGYVYRIIIATEKSTKTVFLNDNVKATKAEWINKNLFLVKDQQVFVNRLQSVPDPDYIRLLNEAHNNKKRIWILGKNFYATSPQDPISSNELNVVTLEVGGRDYGLFFRQEYYKKIANYDLQPEEKIDNLVFLYLGNNLSKVYKIPNLQEKLRAIAEAAYNTEKTFGENFINEVHLVDLRGVEGSNQAVATEDGRFLYFPDYIKEHDIDELRGTTEHEILHLLHMRYKYDKNPEVMKVFRSFKKEKELQETIAGLGKITSRGNKFFDFINESNYLGFTPYSGHSQDNVGEFCASFIHSCMYVRLLERNLARLSEDDREIILKFYLLVVEIFSSIAHRKHKKFFRDCVAVVKLIRV